MTEAMTNGPTPRRAPRWMKILLGVSLALNLGVAAAAAGIAIRHGGPPHGGPGFRDIGGFARFVPEARQDAARAELESHKEEFSAARDRMRAAREKVGEIFMAEPYDAEALAQALAEMRAASGESQAPLHEAMIKIGATLTPEERAQVIETFRERGRRWRERRDWRSEDGEKDGR